MDPGKDADGLHPMNLGRLVLGEPAPCPAPPTASSPCCAATAWEIKGAEVVVVGRGVTIGRPMPLLLTRRSENATVTQCHTGTRDLAAHLRRADIIVAAAGSAHLIRPEDVKPGAAVLDVGVSRNAEGKIVGERPPGRGRGGRLGRPEPRRRRPDDPGPAAGQRGRGGGAQCRLSAAPRTPPRSVPGTSRSATPSARPTPRARPRRTTGGSRCSPGTPRAPRAGAGPPPATPPAPARQWPILAVLLTVGLGLLLTALDQFRLGTLLVGAALLAGSLLRWLVPDVGMLAVRSRFTDIVTYAGLGLVIVLLALMVQPKPLLEIPFLKDTLHFTVDG
ncbi:hypothetical protein GCM10023238_11730 [Streptomyces heliomycini]